MSVEVERKFVCNPDIQKKLTGIGAVCVGQCQFHDQYYDSPGFHLTLNDVWLRCRQGSWELKCPATEKQQGMEENQGERLCTRYKEITSLPQIIAKVREVMKEACEEQNRQTFPPVENEVKECNDQGHRRETLVTNYCNEPCIKQGDAAKDKVVGSKDANRCCVENGGDLAWLREMNLAPFAEFTTERCSFLLDAEGKEGGVRVDLDQADFGYCVGEIEVLVSEGHAVQSAMKKIERTAHRLGLSDDQKVEGKMHVYLQRYCPEHYAKLLSAHIL
ncbi:hypothetical protein JZ751_003869 [Albula glossodonta]|uniref:Thiamine-triphosphatase n=1 Tax=Albula glossodonta TaxID=121402 RepID=A0A8T2P341_9TELE|nr:hypothetical protein JZ751_003869 [Albula glossodonta]